MTVIQWIQEYWQKQRNRLFSFRTAGVKKSWNGTFPRVKVNLFHWLRGWTQGSRQRDFLYMGVAAILLVGIAYVWFNIGMSLAEKKYLAEKDVQSGQPVIYRQNDQKDPVAGREIEEQAVSSAEKDGGEPAVSTEVKNEEEPSETVAAQEKTPTAADASPDKPEVGSNVRKQEEVPVLEAWSRPVEGQVLAKYGQWYFHPIYQDWRYETGIDFSAEIGDPILAAAGGVVKEVMSQGELGSTVIIDDGSVLSEYSYCFDVGVKPGQEVKKGEQIGILEKMGDTNPFLHFEVIRKGERVNPENYLKAI